MSTKPKRYVFRWKDGSIEVPSTWDYHEGEVWRVAVAMLRPVTMKASSDAEIEKYLREMGEVVEYAAS